MVTTEIKLQDKLTILIPTYNRKERLLKTLNSIFKQGHIGEYEIVIVDNCSDFLVKEIVLANFPEYFTCNIHFHRWLFNTGMSTNISIAFEFVNTKWCWFISDDDEILDGALDIVLSDCKTQESVCAIKYSIEGICSYNNECINSVNSWANFYIKNNSGDKGYLAMLYNIERLYPYLPELTVHSYSYLSFWIPIIECLNNEDTFVLMSSSKLYVYKQNNDGWSSSNERYLNTLLGIRTFFDFDYNLSPIDNQTIFKMFAMYAFKCKSIVKAITLLDDNNKRRRYFNLLRPYLYGSFITKFIYIQFCKFVIFTNISPRFIMNLKQIIKK